MSRSPLATLFALTLVFVAQHALAADEAFKRYEIQKGAKGPELVVKDVARPAVGKEQILVRMRAVSLNHRDLYVIGGMYPAQLIGKVPVSDGAGEVLAIGPNVTRFKVGDKVVGTVVPGWVSGKPSGPAFATTRGGEADGMLAQLVLGHEQGWLRFPQHLSFEEAATLPCAGVTAWVGLFTRGGMTPGQFVLLEGTGGVSIFGLQFAAAAGAKPIITSSSDAKLERTKALGAVGTVNYKTNPDWEKDVRKLSNGAGVDQVLEVGGKDTIGKAAASLAMGGHIALIGGLTGFGGQLNVNDITSHGASMSSIFVGSRADFEAMNAFIEKHRIKPVVDRVFEFNDATAAFDYLKSGSHFGKVVVRL